MNINKLSLISSGLLSDKTGMLFKLALNKNSFYLAHHQVQGQCVLPGAAYLEIIRFAASLAVPNNKINHLKDIVWLRPTIVGDEEVELLISLRVNEKNSNRLHAEVTSHSDKTVAPLMHAQMEIWLNETFSSPLIEEKIDSLKTRLMGQKNKQELYAAFNACGLQYGETFQCLDWCRHSDTEAISHYSLATILKENYKDWILHPSIIDAIFQTPMVFQMKELALALPFSLENLQIYNAIPENGYIRTQKRATAKAGFSRFDFQLFDDNNNLCLALSGFSLRAIKMAPAPEKLKQEMNNAQPINASTPTQKMPIQLPNDFLSYFKPVWKNIENKVNPFATPPNRYIVFTNNVSFLITMKEAFPHIQLIQVSFEDRYNKMNENHYTIRYDKQEDYTTLLNALEENKQPSHHIIFVPPTATEVATVLAHDVLSQLLLVQQMMRAKIKGKSYLATIFVHEDDALSAAAMLIGFGRTLQREHSSYLSKIISYDQSLSPQKLSVFLREELNRFATQPSYVRYSQNCRKELRYENCTATITANNTPSWRDKGTYLITGGLGGLGLIFSRYLAEHYHANLVLTGRTASNAEIQTKLDQLKQLGANPIYLSGDVTASADVDAWIAKAKEQFKNLNGIIHSAGINADKLIILKNVDEFFKVAKIKIEGVLNLDKATQNEQLDMFVMFSSIASILGNVGQADYATGNAFLDIFAFWRQQQVALGKRYGKTIAINWPLWAEGGMQVSEIVRQSMESEWGMQVLPTANGMAALNAIVSNNESSVIVAYKQNDRLLTLLQITHPSTTSA